MSDINAASEVWVWVEWLNEISEDGGALVVRLRQEWSKLHPNADLTF